MNSQANENGSLEVQCEGCGKDFASIREKKIHQTKMKCGSSFQRTVITDKSSDSLSQDINHRAQTCPEMIYRRVQIEWPPYSDSAAWKAMDSDLSMAAKSIKGNVNRKVQVFCEMIKDYGLVHFGEKEVRKRKEREDQENRRRKTIGELRAERRRLRAAIRANPEEKEAIEVFLGDINKKISRLARAERKATKRRQFRQARKSFTEDPFRFTKNLFKEKTSGMLNVPKAELEHHLQNTYSDESREEEVSYMQGLNRPSQPGDQFNEGMIKLGEVQQVVKKARGKAAAGPNGIMYRVYKNCPGLLKCLWRLLVKAWEGGIVADSWCQADGIYIPKEEHSVQIGQFRSISLLNVKGKIYVTVLAKRLTNFLLNN